MERKVKQKILIVDDKPENLFALEQILRQPCRYHQGNFRQRSFDCITGP